MFEPELLQKVGSIKSKKKISQKNDQNSKKYKLQNKALKRFDDNKSIFNQIKELM